MREFLNAVVSANISDEITEFATKEITKIDEKNLKKKNSKTPTQKQNEELKAKIYNEMEIDKTYTASELAKIYGVSTQKISALMRQMTTIEIIDNYKTDKGKVKGYKKVEVDKAEDITNEVEEN